MLAGVETLQLVVLAAIGLLVGYLYAAGDPRSWYEMLSERLIYGIPWGTLVSVLVVVSFYLFAQSGLQHWDSPVTLPFRSWSYFYPEGLFAAGFAHAGPNHLIGNLIGTVVLAPIVEYAWSHYPPAKKADSAPYEYPPPGDVSVESIEQSSEDTGWLGTPWIRAVVIFPAIVVLVSILTSLLALGWSLGFSGTVFAFGGFAVVYFPLTAVLAMVGITGTSVLVTSLREPVLRATAEPGAPGPPGWWGVNVQAHMLGFLLGVLLAVVLLRYRSESRRAVQVFLAALAFGLTRQLWAFATSGGEDIYLMQRGIGFVFVVAIAVLIGVLVGARDEPVPELVSRPWMPTRRTLAYLWFVALFVLAGILWIPIGFAGLDWFQGVLFALVLLVFVIPSLPTVLPDRIVSSPLSQKQLLLFALIVIVVIVALPSYVSNAPGMSDDPVPDAATVTIEDYHVTYAEDTPHGRFSSNESGVIVVSNERDIWSSVVDKSELAHDGEATVVVGGFGWRDTVDVNRTGWSVAGSDAVYAVDLEHDGETTRAFESLPAETRSVVANQSIAVVAASDGFRLNVTSNGDHVGTTQMPALNQTRTVGDLALSTEMVDDTRSVFASQDGTRILVASREE